MVAVGSGQSQNALATVYLVAGLRARRLLDVFSLPVTHQVVAPISWLRGETNALSFLCCPIGCVKTQTPLVNWGYPPKGSGTRSGPLGLAWHLGPANQEGSFMWVEGKLICIPGPTAWSPDAGLGSQWAKLSLLPRVGSPSRSTW